MTIIVYHKGELHADNCVVCHFPNDHVKTTGNKIHVSECARFAMAFCGSIPSEGAINFIEQVLLQKLNLFYQTQKEQIPLKKEDFAMMPMLIDPAIIMTAEHVWVLKTHGGIGPENMFITPAENGVPVCLGSGSDAFLALWALGIPQEKAFKRIAYYDPNCSDQIKTVKRSDLKPFTYVEVEDGQRASAPVEGRESPATKRVPARKRVTGPSKHG